MAAIPHVVVDTDADLDLDRLRAALSGLDATVSVQRLDSEHAVMTAAVDAEAVVVAEPSVFSDHSLTSMPDLEVVVVAGATAAGLDLDAAGWAGIDVLAVPLADADGPDDRATLIAEQLRLALGDGEPTTLVE
jgi:phosphoglycerate dehydrogenase-like enzyme